MNDFQKQCAQFIGQFAERRLLGKSGRRLSVEAGALLRRKPVWMERGVGLAAAMLARPDWRDEPRSASGIMDAYARETANVQCKEVLLYHARPAPPNGFDMLTLIPMLNFLLPRATARERALWLRTAGVLACASRDFLLNKEAAWGRPLPYTGCGPNHLFIISSSLYRLGRLLEDNRCCRLASRAMHKLCRLQAREGYFPENDGPSVGYHCVSMFGLRDYYAASGDRFVEPFLARGLEFRTRAMYPNLAGIETLDQRNRGSLRIGQSGVQVPGLLDAGLAWNPLGRRLAQRTVALLQEQLDRSPEGIGFATPGVIALAALLYVDGPSSKALPCERKSFVDRFEDKAGILRRDGWMVVLSGYGESNRPGDPFILDRTQNISVFNDAFGLIVGGGNDKRNFHAATFELVESGYVYYFPPIGGSTRVGGRAGRVALEYGPAAACLSAVIRSPRRVELTAGSKTTFAHQENRLNLQIPVGPGAVVRIDGRRVKLDGKATEPRSWRVNRWFEPMAGVRIETPGAGEFRWPVLPFDSYNIPAHTSTIAAATGYLRLSLSGGDLAERTVLIHLTH